MGCQKIEEMELDGSKWGFCEGRPQFAKGARAGQAASPEEMKAILNEAFEYAYPGVTKDFLQRSVVE